MQSWTHYRIPAFRETNRKKHRLNANGQTFAELSSMLTDPTRFPKGKDKKVFSKRQNNFA